MNLKLETCALTKRAYGGYKEGYSELETVAIRRSQPTEEVYKEGYGELETDTKVNTELCAANGFCFNQPAAEAHYA